MKNFDRFMGLNPEVCHADDPHYRAYDIGKKVTATGIVLCVGSLVGESLGLGTAGNIAAIVGIVLDMTGGASMAVELPHLDHQTASH
jgi:uncharacterized protein YcfJ